MNEVAAQSVDNTNQPVADAPQSAPISTDNLTGEQALALTQESKATGKSIETLLKEKQGAPLAKRGPDGKFTSTKEVAADPVKDAAKEVMKKYKVKVDGEELEVDESELLRGYSHQRAANKKLQEGVAARKQAEQFINLMKDPEQFYEVARKIGHDPRSLAEKYLVKQLEEEMLDPKEKELRETKRKLQTYEEQQAKQKQAVEQKRMDELKGKYVKEYEEQFVAAIKEVEIPPTKEMIASMAKYIAQSAKVGFKMTPKEAAQLVKEDVQKAQLNLVKNADGETLLKLFGDDVAKKILTARGQKVKQPTFQTPTEQGERRELSVPKNRRMSHAEWRAYNLKK